MFKYYLSFPEHVALPWNLVKILIWGLERQVGITKEKNSECGPERGGQRPIKGLRDSIATFRRNYL
jgi:hypothetical protein